MENKDLADRLILEQLYDRPSFHCGHPPCTVMGRLGAVIDQHIDQAHRGKIPGGVMIFDGKCLCGFDVAAELLRLYPEMKKGSL